MTEPNIPKTTILLMLTLAGLLVLFFYPVIFQEQSLFYRDILNFHYPLWVVSSEFVQNGECPLWNPGIHFGQAIGGNPNYLLFYPPAWIRFVMHPFIAFHLFILGHIFLGGLAFFFLCLKWRMSHTAAFWGSLFYAFSGANLSLTSVLNLVPYIFLVPAIMVFFEGFLNGGRRRNLAMLSLTLAMMVTVFEPVMIVGVGILIGGRFIVFAFKMKRTEIRRNRLGGFILALVLAGILAGPVLLEGVRLLLHTKRFDQPLVSTTIYTQHPILSLEMWVSNPLEYSFSGKEDFHGERFYGNRDPYIMSIFLGFGTLFLLIWPFVAGRFRWSLLGLSGALFFLVMSWGMFVPWIGHFLSWAPILQWARYPQKFMIFTSALLIMLSAFGLDLLIKNRWTFNRSGIFRMLFLILPAGIIVILANVVPEFSLNGMVPFSIISALIVPVCILRPSQVPFLQWAGPHIIGVCITAELILCNSFAVPFAPRQILLHRGPILESVKDKGGDPALFRVVTEPHLHIIRTRRSDAVWYMSFLKNAGYPYFGLTQNIQYAFDLLLDKTHSSWMSEFQESFWGLSLDDRVRIMQRTGVRYLISHNQYRHPLLKAVGAFPIETHYVFIVYHVTGSTRRVFFTSQYREAALDTPRQALAMMLEAPDPVVSMNQKRETSLNQNLKKVSEKDSTKVRMDCRPVISAHGANFVQVDVQNNSPGLLVFRDSFFPGWQVHVDGNEADLKRVDFFFMGVCLQPGHHRVEFRYDPPGFAFVLILSLLAGLAMVGLLLIRKKK